MPIFVAVDGDLRPVRQVRPGPELYELEIQELIWNNVEAFYGSDLFPVAMDQKISTGGRPDIVALDESGRIVIFEVKRSIERSQLAQCLEYAGWARNTSLDELSALYSGGADAFFADWLEFTGGSSPVIVNPSPILVLVAQDFDHRTSDALAFLTESGLPVYPVPVSVFENERGERQYLIDSEFEELDGVDDDAAPKRSMTTYRFKGERVTISHLMEAGFLDSGETIEYRRAREGKVFVGTLTPNGQVQVEDGRVFGSLSRAAATLAGVGALPGWEVWFAPARGGRRLMDIRDAFLANAASDDE